MGFNPIKALQGGVQSLQQSAGRTVQAVKQQVSSGLGKAQQFGAQQINNLKSQVKDVQKNASSFASKAQQSLGNATQKNIVKPAQKLQQQASGFINKTVNKTSQALNSAGNEARTRFNAASKVANSPYQAKPDPTKPKAQASVSYAQNASAKGPGLTAPNFLKPAVDFGGKVDQFMGTLTGNKSLVESGNAQREFAQTKEEAIGFEPVISATRTNAFDGKGVGAPFVSAGVQGTLVRGDLGKASASLEKKEGSVNAYNANENLLTRATNAAGNVLGNVLPKASTEANAKAALGWFFGVRAQSDPAKGSASLFAGGELNAQANTQVKGGVAVNLPFNLGRINLGGSGLIGADAAAYVGPRASVDPAKGANLGWYGVTPGAGITGGAAATHSGPYANKNNFPDLNAAGQKSNGDAARKIQGLFQVSDAMNASMVTVNASNNNKLFVGPANRDRGTVYEWGGKGKYDQNSNPVDKSLANNYVRIDDKVRWINEIGRQNAGNQNAVFSQVKREDLELLNRGKVKDVVIDGKVERVISTENINTGIIRNADGVLQRAKSVDLGRDGIVNLK
jgi:hypothetical protein